MNQALIKISAVIPAYNVDRYIERAIKSVLAQTYPPDEIIVVDDGSTDKTAEVVSRFGDSVRTIYQDNAGSNQARNTGIEAAQNEWIALLDGDDEWLEKHLENQSALLRKEPELVWSCANYLCHLDSENRRAAALKPDKVRQILSGQDYSDDYLKTYALGITGHTDTMVIKRDTLMAAGLFTSGLYYPDDMDMWFRIAYRHPRIGFVGEPGAIHHLDAGTISLSYKESKLYCDFIERHLQLSRQAQREKELIPLAGWLLRRWMRGMLFDSRAGEIRSMMEQFDTLLSRRYKIVMRLLTQFPEWTAGGCRLLSKIIRKFRLRQKLVLPPGAKKEKP